MNRTKEQIRKAVFGKLQGLRRKLLAHGVPCTYARGVLSHVNGGTGFTITYRVADDGTTLLPQIAVRTAAGTENLDHLPLDLGLARVKELFSGHHAGNGQASSSDTQDGTNGQATGSHDAESDSSRVVDLENQTPFSHEGDAK